MCRIRCPAFLALLLVLLLAPAPALADEVDVLGGFGRGLDDFYNPKTVDYSQVPNPQQQYEEDYEPVYAPLAAPAQREITDDNAIQVVTDSFNSVRWGASSITWLYAVQHFLGFRSNGQAGNMRNNLILPAIGLAFMWWGVRKVLRMVNTSFKKKRLDV